MALSTAHGGVSYGVHFILENIGKTPALNINAGAWFFARIDDTNIQQRQREMCSRLKAERGIFRWAAFPGGLSQGQAASPASCLDCSLPQKNWPSASEW